MAKFISFDGTLYINADKVSRFEIVESSKELKGDELKTYLYFEVYADGDKVYESVDFKIIDGKFTIDSGFDGYKHSVGMVREAIMEV